MHCLILLRSSMQMLISRFIYYGIMKIFSLYEWYYIYYTCMLAYVFIFLNFNVFFVKSIDLYVMHHSNKFKDKYKNHPNLQMSFVWWKNVERFLTRKQFFFFAFLFDAWNESLYDILVSFQPRRKRKNLFPNYYNKRCYLL